MFAKAERCPGITSTASALFVDVRTGFVETEQEACRSLLTAASATWSQVVTQQGAE